MYKATVRALIKHGMTQLERGNPEFLFRLASPDVELAFPGDNSWSTVHRAARPGRDRHVTHRGVDECRAFAQRFIEVGINYRIEDILVNGPPWNMRVAVRAYDYIEGADGVDDYNNRAVSMLEMRWGRLIRWETYEDTQRLADWDARHGADER